ncbi:hypothetical protein [uncultured Sunxiuqinia sp.]|uniref:hypothetical protein n=1 Tax=uncultured Sunxiuqinia sp. TaxID=1573825 RepID=UPI00262D0CD1|nr:hypothetical protein [uncultured Sunxiuqinia sp.]
MAITIIDQPDTVSLTGCPIRFVFQSDLTYPQVWIRAYIMVWINGAYVNQLEDKIVVDADGVAVFQFQALLNKHLESKFSFPEHEASLMIAHPQMSVKYQIVYGEIYKPADGPEQPLGLTFGDTYYAIRGGLPNHVMARMNVQQITWWEDVVENKRFLTNQPLEKTTYPVSVEKLYWIMRSTGTITLKFDWTATDDSTGTYTTTHTADAYQVVEICLSPGLIEALTGKELAAYTVSISGLSEERTFTVDRQHKERYDRLLFDNSLGTFDTLTATGMRTQTGENSRESYRRQLPTYPELNDRTMAYNRAERVNKNESSLGFLNTQEWLEYTEELDLSCNAYWLDGSVAKPINIVTTESVTLEDERDYFTQNIEWELAHKSKWYARQRGTLQFVIPPYINKLSAFFNRARGIKLLDLRFNHMAIISGTNITFPNITGNDLFDFSDATYWDQTLIAATGWYNAGTPRTCPLSWLQGWAWAEAATDATHARLFHRDYNTKLRDVLPVLVYSSNLSTAEQQTVVDWLDWYYAIFESTSLLVENNDIIIE